MSYADKLRDPKWQKRRLEIMERDKWTCLACADTKSTLNVHHLIYSNEPWDSPDHHLETLCEACHEKREEFNKIYGRSIMPTHGLFAFLVFNQILKNHPTRRIISDRLGMEFHFYLCCRKAEELNISTEAASALIRNTTHEKILKTLFAKIPHTTIVNCFGDKYLTRWYLFRRKSMGLFLHLFHRSDEDRAFHDHPWNFISLILWRGYHEHTDIRCTLCVGGLGYNAFSPVACPRCNGTEIERVKRRKYPGMILYRPAEWAHRVELLDGKPALTLILRFKNRREWGYHLATGWLSHDKWWSNNCE